MTDEELVKSLRIGGSNTAADRIEALVAEVAGLRVERGRVPESWDECADWLDAGMAATFPAAGDGGGRLGFNGKKAAANLRNPATRVKRIDLADVRLLPPPHLVAAPAGMDGGGFLGAGEHVPNGWEVRYLVGGDWFQWHPDHPGSSRAIVQCRPPVKPPQRATVEVPLTQLVGRTIEGCAVAVNKADVTEYGQCWWALHDLIQDRRDFPAGTLDLSTGLVRVYAEGDQT